MLHTRDEKLSIKALAGTQGFPPASILDSAVLAHRALLKRVLDSRSSLPYGDPYFEFMREVDTPCPDLILRHRYRKEVVAATI